MQVPLGHQAEPPALGSRSQSPRKLCLYRVVGSTHPVGSIRWGQRTPSPDGLCVRGTGSAGAQTGHCVRAGISPRCSGMRAPPCGWRILVTALRSHRIPWLGMFPSEHPLHLSS